MFQHNLLLTIIAKSCINKNFCDIFTFLLSCIVVRIITQMYIHVCLFLQDHIFIPLSSEDASEEDKEDPVLVVHPNYFAE